MKSSLFTSSQRRRGQQRVLNAKLIGSGPIFTMTRRRTPNEPDRFDAFAQAIAFLSEEALRICLMRTKSILQHAYANLPNEVAELSEGMVSRQTSLQLDWTRLLTHSAEVQSRFSELSRLYVSAQSCGYRRRAVRRFFEAGIRHVLLMASDAPLSPTDLDVLAELTRKAMQRLAEQEANNGAMPASQQAQARKQIDNLVPIGYGSD